MLRQLSRLTRPLPCAGPGALAVAVYADGADELVAARESGFEGVACVDDAARLLGLLCRVWKEAPSPAIEGWARGLLEFVLWMQETDGRWVNFVYDWDGRRNRDGLTSAAGENFWHARAVAALSRVWLTFDDARAEAAMTRGFEHLLRSAAPSDVRTLHMRIALRLIEEAGRADLEPTVRRWADEIVACAAGDVLMNNPDERGTPHLWAHVQEGVLADAGVRLNEPALIEVAGRSARALIEPAVGGSFDRPGTTPYDVASCVFDLDRLAVASDEATWTELAARARAWFDERNPAGTAVYDRDRGRVADGIDEGRVSENSGAEANIEAAGVLMEQAVASVVSIEDHPRPP